MTSEVVGVGIGVCLLIGGRAGVRVECGRAGWSARGRASRGVPMSFMCERLGRIPVVWGPTSTAGRHSHCSERMGPPWSFLKMYRRCVYGSLRGLHVTKSTRSSPPPHARLSIARMHTCTHRPFVSYHGQGFFINFSGAM